MQVIQNCGNPYCKQFYFIFHIFSYFFKILNNKLSITKNIDKFIISVTYHLPFPKSTQSTETALYRAMQSSRAGVEIWFFLHIFFMVLGVTLLSGKNVFSYSGGLLLTFGIVGVFQFYIIIVDISKFPVIYFFSPARGIQAQTS